MANAELQSFILHAFLSQLHARSFPCSAVIQGRGLAASIDAYYHVQAALSDGDQGLDSLLPHWSSGKRVA
jgi:hypothetical protein